MTINVKIIEDSVFEDTRITTFLLKYPRYIHAEFLRHRVFSHSVASSRAIPFEKMLQSVIDDPVIPVRWMANGKGMGSDSDPDVTNPAAAEAAWKRAIGQACHHAASLYGLGVHKSICNRVIEPFLHVNQVVTATDFSNFFALRCKPDVEPTMQALAFAMREAYEAHKPLITAEHLPFIDQDDLAALGETVSYETLARISAARCARLSYTPIGEPVRDIQTDIALAKKLLSAHHMSPFEHQARTGGAYFELSNFDFPWMQFRKEVEETK